MQDYDEKEELSMKKLVKKQKIYLSEKVRLYETEAGNNCTNTSTCAGAGTNCTNKGTCGK